MRFASARAHNPGMRPRLFLILALLLPASAQDQAGIERFRIQSDLLTAFWGRPMHVEAGVVLPPDHKPEEAVPICYIVHGFGGSADRAWRDGPGLIEKMRGGYPRMIHVYLQAQFPMGHHEFADSVNNGPWGAALTGEFIPAIEKRFAPGADARRRFLTGHSSGGWSSLWLQVTYPAVFNGTWSTAPDPVDFRDFIGIDIYNDVNAYSHSNGEPVQLVRRDGKWAMTLKEYTERERERKPVGGQMYSFNAVFSPRGEDGAPMRLYDWETGAIDRSVAEAWKRYDIGLILRGRWKELGPKLRGRLKVWIGTQDTYRLEGAVKRLKADLAALGSDAEILLVEERDHGDLSQPHPTHWPDGMPARIHAEMLARFRAAD